MDDEKAEAEAPPKFFWHRLQELVARQAATGGLPLTVRIWTEDQTGFTRYMVTAITDEYIELAQRVFEDRKAIGPVPELEGRLLLMKEQLKGVEIVDPDDMDWRDQAGMVSRKKGGFGLA